MVDLPHWADFILIAIAITLIAELLRHDFIDKMKTGRGRIYLAQQIFVAIALALVLSIFTNSWWICALCFVGMKGSVILDGFFTRALVLQAILQKKGDKAVLPIDQPTLTGLPVLEKVLRVVGVKLHEAKVEEQIDEHQAVLDSKTILTAKMAEEEMGIETSQSDTEE